MKIIQYKDKKPVIKEDVYGFDSTVIIGDVYIASHVFLLPNIVIRGDLNKILIDEYTNIQDGTVIHTDSNFSTTIGKRVTCGHNVILHGCIVDDDVLLGMGCIVLNGAHIPSKVIIAAGSLIGQNKTLESGYLYAGIPARKVRALVDQDYKYIEQANRIYIDLKQNYQNGSI
ncbi:MAG: gamma carbonic anhydrase family protein [Spirochaetes bacterium]|nr:gamma carbonic anhydrase family protein [Spirochaetota bacterium]NLJ05496.1 gamma carbonic anhydrase family protein [Exilispira sp.]MBP8991659.1 gamma carbonic anhydrase family protein [Spirochaetota bacterium]HOV46490.1 gamma carbonic anhydrase family protein [Exilispira sp.]HQJ40912.1 gamma carbonic anhydrase family protein [Exilispira sp.]